MTEIAIPQTPTGKQQPAARKTPLHRRIIAAVLAGTMVLTFGQGLGLIGLPAEGLTGIVRDYFLSGNPWHWQYLPF